MSRFGYWAAWAGRLVVAAALAWVGWRLWAQRDLVAELSLGPARWFALYGVVLVYTGVGVLLSLAWTLAVRALSSSPADHRLLLSIHLKTQIAKYLPGNVFHYAGRQVLGKAEGLAQMPLAVASGLEIVGQAAAGAVLMIAAGLFLGDLPDLVSGWIFFLVIVLALSMPWWLRMIPFVREVRIAPALIYGVQGLYFVYLGLLAAIFSITVWLLAGNMACGAVCLSAFVVAWTLGFLVPGAPGGIGVREAVLVALLAPSLGEGVALAAALVFRVISVVGDLHLYGLALWVRSRRGIR